MRGAICEDVDREAVFARDRGICHLCLDPVSPERWDMDHVIPLFRGGHHSYANLAVAHPTCNRKKATKLVEELTAAV